MQCYSELLPPTAVTHALSLPFVSPDAPNLLVARTSLLQLFAVTGADGTSRGTSTLTLIGEYPVSGTVTSLVAIKGIATKSGGDAALVSFQDAKLSLLEWDSDNYRLGTVSIHYYEGENVLSQPFGPSLSDTESILTVDPVARCAALKFGTRNLAILPFRQAGDELVEDGADEEAMDGAPTTATLKEAAASGGNEAGEGEGKQTPYKASFVLSLTALDPALTHPVHLSFLHEYREPAFGILSAAVQPSSALLETRKDILSYTVITLDLEQRASTNLVSVPKLPSDLWKVVPLSPPVGGALLIGANELVHVDQSGKTNAMAVNEFAMVASNFNMTDHSKLNMKLEGCQVEILDPTTGDLLIVLSDGSMAVLSFKLLGRNVGGFELVRVTAEDGGSIVEGMPSGLASLGGNQIFVGTEDGDSVLLAWSKPTPQLSRKRSHAQMLDGIPDDEEDEEEVDEDDLYAVTATAATSKRAGSLSGPTAADGSVKYTFAMLDTLPSLGPINNICFGRSPATSKDKLEMLAGIGRGKASRLAILSRDIVPRKVGVTAFDSAKSVWSICTKRETSQSHASEEPNYDNMIFACDGGSTRVYDVSFNNNNGSTTSSVYTEHTGTDFERDNAEDGETVDLSTLAGGSRVTQCRRSEVRIYDADDLSMCQIMPMLNDADEELKIVHTSFCDPYVLIIREDSSAQILQADKSGDVELLDTTDAIDERKWLSGCLYAGDLTRGDVVLFLLDEQGGLHVCRLPDMHLIYSAPTLPYLPPVLSSDSPQRRAGAKETLTEILVADLGNGGTTRAYMVVRSALDDLTLYEPFHCGTGDSHQEWTGGLRWRKVPFAYVPKFDETTSEEGSGRPAPLRSMTVGGYATLCLNGASPGFVIKTATSLPKFLALRTTNVTAVSSINTPGCEHGLALLTSDHKMQECQFPASVDFGTGWSVRKIALGDPAHEVRFTAFHEERGTYVIATCRDVDFYFPEDDGRHQEQDDISLRPKVPQYAIHLLSSRTHDIIHSFDMPYLDTVTSFKVMSLEVSEHTHKQRALIVAGTAAQRGEDMPAKGAVTVFDILDVVPEPDRPESGIKLHVLSREETRGAVTAVEPFANGLIGTAQGQKIMIRGLKEDGSCLPVAFLDAQCHTTQLKTLSRTGMWLAGDAWKGIWFGGFVEEPYQLSVLGKSRSHMEIVTAEFLPFDGQLFVMVVDAHMDLHVLQYDPENPKSVSGSRLMHRSTFHLGHWPTSMTLLPSTLAPIADQQPLPNGHHASSSGSSTPAPDQPPPPALFHILITTLTGSLALLTPLDESTYRCLGALQTHLTSLLEHPAGLNPRAYRSVENESLAADAAVGGGGGGGARGVVDGGLVQRIRELGFVRRMEVLGRAGADAWGLRSDLEILGGGGLDYL